MKHDWRAVPIPERMTKRPKDDRGFPIPANVLVRNGKPFFTINDSNWSVKALHEHLCPLCGEKITSAPWFVGGPLSCFHDDGAFIDLPAHYECAAYALQVCPYLVMPSYGKRLDDTPLKQQKRDALAKEAGLATYIDPVVISTRPPFFGLCQTTGYRATVKRGGLEVHLKPKRPWLQWQVWASGSLVTDPVEITRLFAEYQRTLDGPLTIKTPTLQRVA